MFFKKPIFNRTVRAAAVVDPFSPYTVANCALLADTRTPECLLAPGIEYEIFHTLSQIFSFSYDFLIPEDDNYGILINGTWNGIMKMLIDGDADISATFLSYTEQRAEYVDFGYPLFYFKSAVAVKTPGFEARFVLFKPFQPSVWACGAIFGCIFTGLLVLIDQILHGEPGWIRSALDNAWLVAVSSVNQGVQMSGTAITYMLAICVWHLPLVILSASYMGSLTSFLTAMPTKPLPFDDIESFVDLLDSGRYVLIDEGKDALRAKLVSSSDLLHTKILSAMERDFVLWETQTNASDQDYMEMFNEISRNPKLAHFGQSVFLQMATYNNCDVTVFEFDTHVNWMSVVFPKNSSLTKPFNEALVGAVTYIKDLEEEKYMKRYPCKRPDEVDAITLQDVQETFWIFLAGLFAAIFILAAEIVLMRRIRRHLEYISY